jgi:hypothetical protein
VKSDQDTTGLSGGGSRSLLPGSGAAWLETGEAINYRTEERSETGWKLNS